MVDRSQSLFDNEPAEPAAWTDPAEVASRPRPAPHNRTATSIEAAERIAPKAGTMRARVLDYIAAAGEIGATNAEIAAGLGMKLQTVCGRVNELATAKLIRNGARRDGGTIRIAN